MTIRLNGATSGYTEIDAPSAAGNNTLILPTGNGSASQYLQTDGAGALSWNDPFRMVLGTAKASTSGTSIDFSPADGTGIPSWAKRVTVMFQGVSLSGTNDLLIQLGDSGGIENTGYLSAYSQFGLNSLATANSTSGFTLNVGGAARIIHGSIQFTNLTGNTWTAFGGSGDDSGPRFSVTAGSKTLSATLDRVRITASGADTFDAGSINIMYEG